MGVLELEYPVKHPYPRSKSFMIATCVLVVLVLPFLVIINGAPSSISQERQLTWGSVVTVGYELVPSLQPDFSPDKAASKSPRLPRFLRRTVPLCQPKDIGRGDTLRLSPSLFEYNVLSSWRTNSSHLKPQNEGRVEYRGGSFSKCTVYEMLFDHSTTGRTQTVTAGIMCPNYPVKLYMEARIVLAMEISKDLVGQYYGYGIDMQSVDDEDAQDYRRSVFGVLDILSTDSIGIMLQQHLSTQVDSISFTGDATSEKNITFHSGGTIVYQNGTVTELERDNNLAEAELYRASITNIMIAVHHAVELDLANPNPGNIFLNPAAINDTLSPNIAPAQVGSNRWLGDQNSSFAYGDVVPPYQTWAQMMRAGLPNGIPLGNLTGLPSDSKMVTNYLCPVYRLKPTGTLLANVFIGTATMFLSVWAAWMTISAMIAKRMKDSCMACSCSNPAMLEQGIAPHGHHHNHERALDAPCCESQLKRDPTVLVNEKGSLAMEDSIQELPKVSLSTGATVKM